MPKTLLVLPFLLVLLGGSILLLTWGYQTAQARTTPWDCADWQAFAHEDRTTAILESLAENRGKTLYCGIDQSDTFAKAETWQAGKDRNERDDTIYWGERGNFRGFIAAQEGWLTEGESGITGQSIDRIFEFPREQRRGWKNKNFVVPPSADRTVHTGWGQFAGDKDRRVAGQVAVGQSEARARFSSPIGVGTAVPYNWLTLSEPAAQAHCQRRGWRLVGVTPSPESSDLATLFEYRDADNNPNDNWYRSSARKVNTWGALCRGKVRR